MEKSRIRHSLKLGSLYTTKTHTHTHTKRQNAKNVIFKAQKMQSQKFPGFVRGVNIAMKFLL